MGLECKRIEKKKDITHKKITRNTEILTAEMTEQSALLRDLTSQYALSDKALLNQIIDHNKR